MLTVLVNEGTMKLKIVLVAFQIQVNRVYLSHVTYRVINPGSGEGDKNAKALATCRNIPSSGFLHATELAEV